MPRKAFNSMSEDSACPVVRSFLEIPRAAGESDKDELHFDAIQEDRAQELLIVSAQGVLCRVRSFVRNVQTQHYSRRTEVIIEFDRKVTSVAFSCENSGRTDNQKLLFVVTRDGCLWCFREEDLRLSGRWKASYKCAASLSSQKLLGANVLIACPDLPILIASGHTLGPPQLIHFASSSGESPIINMQSKDFPGMERVESLVTSVLCLSKDAMSPKLQRALGKRYLSDSSLGEPQDYDAAAVLGFADGTVHVSLVTVSDQGVNMTPTRLLGWLSGENQQAVVAIVPSRGDQNLVDSLLWFGSSGQTHILNDTLVTCCVCAELRKGGALRAAVPVAIEKEGGSRLVLAVKRDGTSHIYSFVGQLDGVPDNDALLCAKVPLRDDISSLRSVKCFDPSQNLSTSCFVGATLNGTLICFSFDQNVGEEIFLDADARSIIQSPLQQYWSKATSTAQANPRLENLLRNVRRLERREDREVAALELQAVAEDARHVSQTIQEVCRHGQRKRVCVEQDHRKRAATMVDEPQRDKSKALSEGMSMHVSIESNKSAISSCTARDGNGRDVLYGGTVVSFSDGAASSRQKSLVFEQTENETGSYYTSLSVDRRKTVNSPPEPNEERSTSLIFTTKLDPIA
jgi:hypothetical protein